jgi:hypothetical protein
MIKSKRINTFCDIITTSLPYIIHSDKYKELIYKISIKLICLSLRFVFKNFQALIISKKILFTKLSAN